MNVDAKIIEMASEANESAREASKVPNRAKRYLQYLGIYFLFVFKLLLYGLIVMLVGIIQISKIIFQMIAKWITANQANQEQRQVQIRNLAFNIREMLCQILQENAQALEIVKPVTVEDITPTKENVYQELKGYPYFQFIVQKAQNAEYDKKVIMDLLNIKIRQYVNRVYGNDCANPQIFAVEDDMYHSGFILLKIMYMDSKEKVDIINEFLQKKADDRVQDLCDEDF